MNKITTIFAVATAQAFDVEGKTNSAIIAEVKKAGLTLGAKALASLLKGEKTEAGGFTTVKPEVKTEEQQPAPAVNAEAGAAPAPTDAAQTPTAEATAAASAPAAKPGRTKGPSLWDRVIAAKALPVLKTDDDKLASLTPEQRAIAEKELEEQRKAVLEGDKKSFRGTDWTKVLPQEPQPVRKDSKMHKFFTFLCTPGGVTKDEILKEFGWSAGGLAGIIHWEPKAKGYFLHSEKGADGKLRYSLGYIGQAGRRVKPEEILVAEPKVAAPKAPKSPKAPKAEAAPKKGTEQAPSTGAARVTTRTAAKKAANTPAAS